MRHSPILTLLFSLYFLTSFLSIQARHHFHTKHKHYSHSHNSSSEISLPPAPLPSPTSSAPEEAPSTSPSPSSRPSPAPTSDENNYQNASGLLDVRRFGAIGDGVTDDTESFKMAWDTACQSELDLNVIFVPPGFSFIVQSTIFTGPCKGGLVLKVIYLQFFSYIILRQKLSHLSSKNINIVEPTFIPSLLFVTNLCAKSLHDGVYYKECFITQNHTTPQLDPLHWQQRFHNLIKCHKLKKIMSILMKLRYYL